MLGGVVVGDSLRVRVGLCGGTSPDSNEKPTATRAFVRHEKQTMSGVSE